MINKFEIEINKMVDIFMEAEDKKRILKGKTEVEYRKWFIQDFVNGQIPIIEYRFAEYLRKGVKDNSIFIGFENFLIDKMEKGKGFSILDFYNFLEQNVQKEIKQKVFNEVIEKDVSIKEYFKNEGYISILEDENF